MDAILLAAGNSIRFGKNKLLYQLNGKPLYCHMMELLYEQQKAGILEQVITVSQYEEIFTDIKNHFPKIKAIKNPAPQRGISSSIRLGLSCLEQVSVNSDACLFTVADQPYVTMDSFLKLNQFWRTQACGIAAASYQGQIGNPVIFSAKYYEELKSLEGDTGGKKVLLRHRDDTGLCEIPLCELADVDTQNDVVQCIT